MQVLSWLMSVALVENAFVVRFPKNTCRWEAPGWPGNMIGSSVARCDSVQCSVIVFAPAGTTPTTSSTVNSGTLNLRTLLDPLARAAPYPTDDLRL